MNPVVAMSVGDENINNDFLLYYELANFHQKGVILDTLGVTSQRYYKCLPINEWMGVWFDYNDTFHFATYFLYIVIFWENQSDNGLNRSLNLAKKNYTRWQWLLVNPFRSSI